MEKSNAVAPFMPLMLSLKTSACNVFDHDVTLSSEPTLWQVPHDLMPRWVAPVMVVVRSTVPFLAVATLAPR